MTGFSSKKLNLFLKDKYLLPTETLGQQAMNTFTDINTEGVSSFIPWYLSLQEREDPTATHFSSQKRLAEKWRAILGFRAYVQKGRSLSPAGIRQSLGQGWQLGTGTRTHHPP